MKTKFSILVCLLFIQLATKAQMKIGDNPTSINANSLLELESTNKGFVLPKIALTDVNSSSPLTSVLITGTLVFNSSATTTGGSGTGIYYWNGSKWIFLSTGNSVSGTSWLLTGNSGLNASTNFIGTTDAVDFVARTANIERMRILGAVNGNSKAGWIGMGVTIPRSSLDVAGHYSNKNVLTLQNTSTSGFSSVDMMDSLGNLKGTFGYANAGTGGLFAGKDYFNIYGNDFIFTTNSNAYDFFMKGTSGFIGLNTNNPAQRLEIGGNTNTIRVGGFVTGGTYNSATTTATSNILYTNNATGDIYALPTVNNAFLTTNASGIPSWSTTALSSNTWLLTGNAGTTSANFLGTTDRVSLRFRTGNTQRMIIDSLGNVGIGLNNPAYALSVLSQTNPLYLSGVQATSTFNADSILTINGGVVKKTPYSSLTGNFWSTTGNSGTSYTTNFLGTTDNVSLRFRTNNTEQMMIDSLGRVGIGTAPLTAAFDPLNVPKFAVDYGTTTSNTLAYFKGNANGYFQVNLQNKNSGSSSSTDYVATSDDGTDSTYYIDMGINSSTYAPGIENWGNQHDAYLYASSRNLLIGCQSAGSDVIFLLNGGQIKNNTVLRLKENGNIIVGTGEGTILPTGNILRGPNAATSAPNSAGGNLTINGGSGTGTASGGTLNLNGGITSGSGTGGNININGGASSTGNYGAVNINANIPGATFINTGTSAQNVSVGGNANNILFPKFNTVGGMYYTSVNTGQLSTTGANMTWDSVNNRLGIGTAAPGYKLSVLGNNPLYLSGVQATSTFSSDSVLTILNGVVKATPYSSLTGAGNWALLGNSGTTAANFLGTTDNRSLRFRTNNIQRMIIDSLGKVGIGTNTPASDLTIYQSSGSGNSKGFTFTGNSIAGPSSGTGFLMSLGYNTPGNKQLWLGDGDYAGNASGSFARFVQTGTVFPVIDAVSGDGAVRRYLAFGVAGDANSGVIFGADNTGVSPSSQVWNNGNMAIGNGYKANAAPTNGLLVQGNVGVGVTAPQQALSVGNGIVVDQSDLNAGTTTNALTFGSVSGEGIGSKRTNGGNKWGLDFYTANTNRMVITNGGNVGIGTTAPTNALSVSANNPLYLAGVNYTATLASADSVLIINNGVVKATLPSALSSASSNSWLLTGNSNATGNSFLGTTNAQPLIFKSYGNQIANLDGNTAVGNIAIGLSAVNSQSDHNIAIGYGASTNNQYVTSIGSYASATGVNSVAIGGGPSGNPTRTTGAQSVAIGYNVNVTRDQTVAIGYQAQGTGQYGVAIGYNPTASSDQTVAIGYQPIASGQYGIAIGYQPQATTLQSIAIGYQAQAKAQYNTVMGYQALATGGTQATAIGSSAQAQQQNNTALGYAALATVSDRATALGASAQAQAQNNTAVGYNAKAITSDKITVVGADAQGSYQYNTVVGYGALATSNNQSTSIGASSQAQAQNATALGFGAKANANNSTAVGYNAQTTQANALILGDATNTSLSVGIATSTPNTSARLDVDGNFKLGDLGRVIKNLVTLTGSLNASSTVSSNSYTDVIFTAATAFVTTTQATVNVSPSFDLSPNLYIGFARLLSTTQIRVRFVNMGGGTQTIPTSSFYFSITEY